MDLFQGKVYCCGNNNEHGKEDVVAHLHLVDTSKVNAKRSYVSRFLDRDFQL
jgi:hypothetical protein